MAKKQNYGSLESILIDPTNRNLIIQSFYDTSSTKKVSSCELLILAFDPYYRMDLKTYERSE